MENLIENPFKKTEDDGEEKKKRPIIKSATDLQRLKLEKLMKNPDKPIIIPEQPREKDYMQTVPSFVRNVMGSSAGAGSGEFHVYRHLRRKEYARQKCIQAKSIREQLDDEYQMKLEKNRLEAEAKTAKKRAKRLKKKQRAKKPRTKQNEQKEDEREENTSEDEDDDDAKEEQEKDGTSANDNSEKEQTDKNNEDERDPVQVDNGDNKEPVEGAVLAEEKGDAKGEVNKNNDGGEMEEDKNNERVPVQADNGEKKETVVGAASAERDVNKNNVGGEVDKNKKSVEDPPAKVSDDVMQESNTSQNVSNASTSVGEQESNIESHPK